MDHVTVGNICRSIIEMQVFLGYLLEDGITEQEWQLRKWTLDIHDCNSRLRLFRSLEDDTEKGAFGEQLRKLQERIQTNPLFILLGRDTQARILAGERIYVRGMRAALVV